MAVSLKGLSRKELEKVKADVEKALEKMAKKDLEEARKAAEKAVAKFGVSLSDLDGSAPKKRGRKGKAKPAAAPKYANPNDKSQTWSGRGRQPQWYKDAVTAGAAPESMAI